MSSEILVVTDTEQLVVDADDSQVLVDDEGETQLLEIGVQGPKGAQGIPGPAGGATTVVVGPVPISGHTAVACNAAGLLVAADSTNPAHRGAVLGIVADAYSPGDAAVVQTAFPLEHSGWAWAAGPVFVGIGGALVQTPPPGAVFSQVIAQALAATRVLIDLQPPITTV